MAASVTRALGAIKRYKPGSEQIDRVILSAINVTLCLAAQGKDCVSDGFNRDIAVNGRGFRFACAPARC